MNRVNIGAAPNDRTGDSLREAFRKLDDNFGWLAGDTLAARPPANTVPAGAVYIVTDSSPPNAMFRSDGTAWVRVDAVPDISAWVRRTTNQAVANGTLTHIVFDVAEHDPENMWDAANPTRLTIPGAGVYSFTGQLQFSGSAGGNFRSPRVYRNGVNMVASAYFSHGGSASSWITQVSGVFRFARGDYVTLAAYHDAGVSLDALAADYYSLNFNIARITP